MKKQPLGLPEGSVRAILTLALLALVGATLFIPVTAGAGEVRGGLIAVLMVALKGYFEQREVAATREQPDYYLPEEK